MEKILDEAEEFYKQGELETALKYYRYILDRDPENLKALVRAGEILAILEKSETARRLAVYDIGSYPVDPRFYFNLGLAVSALGKEREAVGFLSEAVQQDPEYGMAFLARANCYLHLGEYSCAVYDYNTALDLETDYNDIYRKFAFCLEKTGEFNDAAENYRIALDNCLDAELKARRGISLYLSEKGDPGQILILLDEAAKILSFAGEITSNTTPLGVTFKGLSREAGIYRAAVLREAEVYEELQEQLNLLHAGGANEFDQILSCPGCRLFMAKSVSGTHRSEMLTGRVAGSNQGDAPPSVICCPACETRFILSEAKVAFEIPGASDYGSMEVLRPEVAEI